MHALNCFIALMEYLEQAYLTDIIDLEAMRQKLKQLVQVAITKDTSIWATSYVCKPSQFFKAPDSIFYTNNEELAAFECEFIRDNRNKEGVWDVTWNWDAYPEEWAITKNWWKGEIVIKNLRYLKNLNRL